tara:strand:+ start:2340 stop:2522 length:183 start_codon:yes stop_codon:yes gene_type:complete
MKTFRKLQENKIRLDGITYKSYTVGNLPPSFGFIYNDANGEDQDGISEWFNYKGLTYIQE